MTIQRVMSSDYMRWAKLSSHATYNLANSGLAGYRLSDLHVRIEDLEINGPVGYGYKPLQQALARKSQAPLECVVATNGASHGNFLAMAALLEPGDEVLIEHPTYELFVDTAKYLGAKVRRFMRRLENDFQIDIRELEQSLTPQTRLIVLTNPNNPTSAFTTEENLRSIGAMARSVGAHVLIGEIYLDSFFEQTPPSAFQLGPEFITTTSLTKIYGLSGLRCGWILAEPTLAEKIWSLNDLVANIPPHAAELLSCAAVDQLDHIRERSRRILDTNHQVFQSFMAKRNELSAPSFSHGTVSFPKLLHGDVEQLLGLLRDKYDTSVVPGKFFGLKDHFRIGLGGETEDFAEGVRRLGLALDELMSRA